MYSADGPLHTCGHQLFTSKHISKRVCRNLTAEFCSESSETSSSSEPNLDLWVLRTLGLKDRDTIDTSETCSDHSLSTLVYNHAASPSSPSEHSSSFSQSFSSSSASSSVLSCCQRSTPEADHGYGTIEYQEINCSNPPKSSHSCTTSPGQHSDFTAFGGHTGSPDAVIRSCDTLTAPQAPPQDPPFTQTTDHFQTTAPSPVQTLEGNPTNHPAYWSPLRCSQTLSQDAIQFSLHGERVHFSPTAYSSPAMSQFRTPVHGSSPMSPSARSLPPTRPQTPHSRTDLAFSMSLSPSSSVKTHSFPQGQAFIRKDNGGRWNFTWVPKQGP
ncbi:geminin coiled-coil domain-containing protein 1 isoform X2 [Xyrichtys novacula]|nr:geminin coiled-coil domain-containing protein 1 isoform X2 [Xyrichtys novacula]